jgi:hypothetical protein
MWGRFLFVSTALIFFYKTLANSKKIYNFAPETLGRLFRSGKEIEPNRSN